MNTSLMTTPMMISVAAGAIASVMIIIVASSSSMHVKTDRDTRHDQDDEEDEDEGNELRELLVCGLDREHVKEVARRLRDDVEDGVRMSKAWRDAARLVRFVNADLLSSLRYVEATLRYWRRVERQPLRRRRRTMVFGRGMLYCVHRLVDAVSLRRSNRFWSDEDEMLVLRVRTIRAVRRGLLQALAIVHSAAATMRSAAEHRGRNGDAVMCTALSCAALRINDAMDAVRELSSNASAVVIQRDMRRGARAQVRRIGDDIDEVWAAQRHREAKLGAAMGSDAVSVSDAMSSMLPSVQDVREALRLAWCTYERRTADTQIGSWRSWRLTQRSRLTGTIMGSRYGPSPSSSSSGSLISRSLVLLPQWCREPSYMQRHWIRVSLLVLLATKSLIVVSRNYEAIRDAYKAGVELASMRFVENVYEPLKFMRDYMFGRRGSPEAGGASTKAVSYDDEYRKELQILDAMLDDFVGLARNQNKQASLVSIIPQSKSAAAGSNDPTQTDNIGGGIEALSSLSPATTTMSSVAKSNSIETTIQSSSQSSSPTTSAPAPGLSQVQPIQDDMDRVEALNLVNTTFQRESIAPVSNMMRGLLSNSLLVQIQKMKCDSIAMLMSIDDVMQKNELTMIGMAAAPALSFLYALLLLVSRASRRRPVDLTEEVFRAKMALAKIDRHLLRVKVGVAGISDVGFTASNLHSHVHDGYGESHGENDDGLGDDDVNAYSIDKTFGNGSRNTMAPFASPPTNASLLEETGTCIFLTSEVYREVFELYARSGSGRGSVYRVREIVSEGPQSDYAKSASSVNPLEFLEMRKYLALLSWPGVAVEDKLRIVESIRSSFDIFR